MLIFSIEDEKRTGLPFVKRQEDRVGSRVEDGKQLRGKRQEVIGQNPRQENQSC